MQPIAVLHIFYCVTIILFFFFGGSVCVHFLFK